MHVASQAALNLPAPLWPTKKVKSMQTKTILSLMTGSFLLLGCAGTNQYPISGQTVGADDQVRNMIAPNVMPR